MMKRNEMIWVLLVVQSMTGFAQASAMDDFNDTLRTIAAALAFLMLLIQGLRWVMSDSSQDRAEAKRGMVYVIMGIIVVYMAAHIVCGIYGAVLPNYGVSCSFDAANFACDCTGP
jgi:predicted membrane channel-forming protein YqfA (hemolysin III family)